MLPLSGGLTTALLGTGWCAVHYQPCLLLPSRIQAHSWLSWSLLWRNPPISPSPLIALMRQGHQRQQQALLESGWRAVGKPQGEPGPSKGCTSHVPQTRPEGLRSFAPCPQQVPSPRFRAGPSQPDWRVVSEAPPGGAGDAGGEELVEICGSLS